MKKLTVIGHFGQHQAFYDGQTVKTKTLTEALERRFGPEQVGKIDTYHMKGKLLLLPLILWKTLRNSENVLILPAQNGLRVIAPLLSWENRFFHKKTHYVVIGGWLPEFLKKHKTVRKALRRFSAVFVETETMKKTLTAMGVAQITVLPNFKDLKILSPSETSLSFSEPYRLCTFSRVIKEKGIPDAIRSVSAVNREFGRTVFSLDIYGQIDGQQAVWFADLQKDFPAYIRYCGTVPFDRSTDVISRYFALLFPTHFYTEGIPGTVLDAFASGVPVIASIWESFSDVIDDTTGIGYEFGSLTALTETLKRIADEPEILEEKRLNCLRKAQSYRPENVLNVLYPFL